MHRASIYTLGILLATSPLSAAQAYVTIAGPSSVSAINLKNPSASKTLLAGKGAVSVALTPDGKKAYVANEQTPGISVLDTTTGNPIADIPLTANPYAVIASPDGSRIYALTQDSSGKAALQAIDTASNTVLFSQSVPGSYGGYSSMPHMPAPAISADGQTIYIATSSLTVFDVTNQTVTATIQTPEGYIGLVGLAVAPDGSKAIVTGNADILGGGRLALIDLRTQATVKLVKLGPNEAVGPVVFSPDGSVAYLISNQQSPDQMQVKAFDPTTQQITTTFSVGEGIGQAIAITLDGSQLEVGNSANATVVAVDAKSGAVGSTAAALGALHNITVSADGQWLYVPNFGSSLAQLVHPAGVHVPVGESAYVLNVSANGAIAAALGAVNLSVINTSTQQVSGTVPLGGAAADVALTPDGSLAYVLNTPFQKAPLLQVVDTQKLKIIGQVGLTADDYPTHIAISPRGGTLYVTDGNCASGCVEELLEISAATLQITGQITVSSSSYTPGDIAITKDGATAYVGIAIPPSQSGIAVVDLANGQVTATIGLPGEFSPTAVALAPDERLLYAAPGVWVVDVQKNAPIATLSENGVKPWQVAVSPDSRLVYVTNSAGDNMLVIAAPPNGIPQIAGTITLPGPSFGVAFEH